MSAPGRLTKDELTTVQPGIQLGKAAGASFRRAKKRKPAMAIAGPAGGYRSEAMQNAMSIAGSVHGTAAARRAWGLNPRSTVAIARHPNGTHEDGSSVDIVGVPITDAFLRFMEEHGFTRPFGPRDPNHFHYDKARDKHLPKKKAAKK